MPNHKDWPLEMSFFFPSSEARGLAGSTPSRSPHAWYFSFFVLFWCVCVRSMYVSTVRRGLFLTVYIYICICMCSLQNMYIRAYIFWGLHVREYMYMPLTIYTYIYVHILGFACERVCVYALNNVYTYCYIFWGMRVREYVYIPLIMHIRIFTYFGNCV